ncbi:hypothetical protein D9M70_449130 [compost metagenome]
MDRQVDVLDDRLLGAIAERDAAIGDVALEAGDVGSTRPVLDIGFGFHEFEEAFEAGNALGVGLDDRIDLLDRAEEHADQQQEADEAAIRQFAR